MASLPKTPEYQYFLGTDHQFLHTLYFLLTPYLRYFVETPTVQVKLAYLDYDLLNRRMVNLLTDLPVVDLLPEDAAFEKLILSSPVWTMNRLLRQLFRPIFAVKSLVG